MTIKVLIVDDSNFIAKRIRDILTQPDRWGRCEFTIVGRAANGLEAIRLCHQLRPDVVTMDVEMPVLDGIGAVKRIMAECPTPILMFSALTQAGAQATWAALEAGAVDYLPKQLEEISADQGQMQVQLRTRVKMVALQAQPHSAPLRPLAEARAPEIKAPPKLILIAASTGGPVALQTVLSRFRSACQVPIVIVQHMPGQFTPSFALRLNQLCAINVRQAQSGDYLQAGLALLAPGGMQLGFVNQGADISVVLRAKRPDELYSPSADITFASAAEQIHGGVVLAVVMTGMGADGRVGAGLLKRNKALVWAQNEQSCTIFGMPKAVIDAGLADSILDLQQLGDAFSRF
ncbi:MAG: chemotaxis response regulator protein-glutamate methylesterase [Methylococcales bacterium]|nr:chemotaxis response regulator protein-glutamate methylesterase [Methylococcales bacterium]